MRFGETSLRAVDVRIITATNHKLSDGEAGRFRADPLYWIRVASIDVPPRRDRIDNLPFLLDYFLKHHYATIGQQLQGVAPTAFDLLMTYS